MHDGSRDFDIDQALAARRSAHSLRREFYGDHRVHREDLERIWYREWIFVAHTAELPEPGSYLTLAIGDHQILLVRGNDGEVHALHNVCRHRGSLICDLPSGVANRRLVCPYHQWSYAFDGTLTHARGSGTDFDRSRHGLGRVHCEVVAGSMIFVSLADDPPDFEPMRTLTNGYLAPFDLATARIAATSVTIEEGNWKLVMENNRECHHCRASHPELCATFPEEPLHTGGASADDVHALERIVEVGRSLGLPSDFLAADSHQFRAMRMPFKHDARSMTMDGAPAVARRFGVLRDVNPDDLNVGDVLLYHYPSMWSHFMADHAITFRILPLGPTTTQLTTTWLVPDGAVEGVDDDVQRLTEVWLATNAQDAALVERAQRGVASPAYRPGPYAPVDELGVIQFVDWYADRMLEAAAVPVAVSGNSV